MPASSHFDQAKAEQIISYIRSGGYEYVAAEAAGITKEAYILWIARGEKKGAQDYYRDFASRVRQAKAQARLLAEIEIYKDNPAQWLARGPGKETKTNPGWSREVKALIVEDSRQINILATPEWNSLWGTILAALGNHPEARLALSQALHHFDGKKAIPPPASKDTIDGKAKATD